jgi:hypothetical protein
MGDVQQLHTVSNAWIAANRRSATGERNGDGAAAPPPRGREPAALLSNEPVVERGGHGLDWSKLRVDATLSGGKVPAAIQYFIFDSLVNAFSYYSWQQQPLWWDPTADVLLTVKRGATNGNQLFYRYSTNRGQSWTQPVLLFDAAATGGQQLPRYPSGYLVNPNNSVTAPEDLLLVFASPVSLRYRLGGIPRWVYVPGPRGDTPELLQQWGDDRAVPVHLVNGLADYGEHCRRWRVCPRCLGGAIGRAYVGAELHRAADSRFLYRSRGIRSR